MSGCGSTGDPILLELADERSDERELICDWTSGRDSAGTLLTQYFSHNYKLQVVVRFEMFEILFIQFELSIDVDIDVQLVKSFLSGDF